MIQLVILRKYLMHIFLRLLKQSIIVLVALLIGLVLINSPLIAKPLTFKKANIELSDNGIRAIIEDHKGFMWFGTEAGLNRFDGINITNYSPINGDTTSLSNSTVIWLHESSQKELWVCTNSGLNLYNRTLDNFERYSYYKNPESDYNFVQQVVDDKDGDLWLATIGGVCLLERDSKSIVDFWTYTNQTKRSEHIVSAIVAYQDGLIGGTSDGKLVSFNKENGTVDMFSFDNGVTENAKPISISQLKLHSNGTFWITTNDGKLLQIEQIEDGHIWYQEYVFKENLALDSKYNYLSSVCEFSDTEILVGAEDGGLSKFNFKTKEFEHYQKGTSNINHIGGNSVWSVYSDSKGRIWIGIFNYGLDIIDSKAAKFKSYKNILFDENSLTHSSITAFAEDSKGNMWITSDGGGLDYWDRSNNTFSHYKAGDGSGATYTDAGLCLYLDNKEQLWCGWYAGGISIYNPVTKSFSHLNSDNGLSSNNVFSITERSNGKIYIGNYGGSLDIYNPEDASFETRYIDTPGKNTMYNTQMNVLFVDGSDNLWIGLNNGGLVLMDERSDGSYQFIRFENDQTDPNSLSNNSVLTINEDRNGNLWIGTRDGLNRLNRKSNRFTIYRVEQGLPSNSIVGILEDDYEYIWISTLNGLSKFDKSTEQFKNYTTYDGLQGDKFNNRSAIYKTKQGELFFGGNDGFTHFEPAEIQYESGFPNVYINGFKLFNKPVSIGGDASPLEKHIFETKEIVLNHKQSVFTIDYIALDFSTPAKIKYAYKLDGMEDEWNYVGNQRTATYTNLDAGTYIFKVRSTNEEGDWNEFSRELKIIVTPPWWETWAFKASVFLIFIAGLYLIYYNKVQSINYQRNILSKKVHERTKDLNELNTQLEEINQEVMQHKEELLTQSDALVKSNRKLEESSSELEKHKDNLEDLVSTRTLQLEQAKEKAEESDRLKSAFLANMSHEIRTPMNAIVGFSNLLRQPILDEDVKLNYINQINSNTNSLLTLIDDILDLSMMESNSTILRKKEFDLNLLLDEVFASESVKREHLNVVLNHKLTEQHLVLNSDRYRIKQILVNLFNNACKFTEKGQVELLCDLNQDGLIFSIKDTGIGISKDNLNMIFNRFSKVNADKMKLFRGAGLGLAISKRIADLLEGDLSVESEINVGSVFVLELPLDILANNQLNTYVGSFAEDFNWSGKNILIVEDEETNYFYLKSALQATRANIYWAQDGSIAVKMFETGELYDMVLMDIKMPSMNGYEATKCIRAINPEQIIISQTAYASAEDQLKMEQAGFNDFLIKPIMPEDLFSVLSKFVR